MDEYWNSTQAEILVMMKAYRRKEQYEMQKQASLIYTHADLIGASVARLFGNNDMPSFKDVFGYLFDEEPQQQTKSDEPKLDAELETSKMRLMRYMDLYNKHDKKGGGANG